MRKNECQENYFLQDSSFIFILSLNWDGHKVTLEPCKQVKCSFHSQIMFPTVEQRIPVGLTTIHKLSRLHGGLFLYSPAPINFSIGWWYTGKQFSSFAFESPPGVSSSFSSPGYAEHSLLVHSLQDLSKVKNLLDRYMVWKMASLCYQNTPRPT